MSDDLRTHIMAVLRERGWTCEYHEPVDALGECKQCDNSHGKTADAVIRELAADYILVPKGHTIARIRSAEKLGLTGDGK